MHPTYRFLYPFVLCFTLLACTKEDEGGTLEVFVSNADGPQAGVAVRLDPGDARGITDSAGTVLFADLPPLDYLVEASHDELGSNSALASVAEGTLTQAIIRLPGRYNRGPEIIPVFPRPDITDGFRDTEGFTFEARLTDDRDATGTIPWELTSSLDGVLGSGVDSAGLAAVYLQDLSVGTHVFTLTATDSEGLTSRLSFNVLILPPAPTVYIRNAVPSGEGLAVSWSRWAGGDFDHYTVYRGEAGSNSLYEIAILNDVNDTVFVDETLPYNRPVDYQVNVFTGRSEPISSEPYTAAYTVDHIDLEATVNRLLSDPKRGLLYGIDQENDRLVVMDVGTRRVTLQLPAGSQPTDLSLSPNGDTLYVAASGGNTITIFDLTVLKRDRVIYLPAARFAQTLRPIRVAALTGGRVALIGDSNVRGLHLYRPGVDTLTLLDVGASESNNLIADPTGTRLFMSNFGGGGQRAVRFDPDGEGSLFLADKSASSNGSLRAVLTADGRYFFSGNAMLRANDLQQVVATFGTDYYNDIRLSNADGSRVMGPDRYYGSQPAVELGPVRAPNRVLAYDPMRGIAFHHELYSTLITLVPFP
ncbi:YncE family protein [Lewinella sp. IMCC34183]|uniref:YncE family protein n=1 Tax=Lewinella sp. IMCC34183 TaxID=2248762 RepID=UPI000E2468F7|nr:hypothetical protein [Lewinella sp. IMCC34183]